MAVNRLDPNAALDFADLSRDLLEAFEHQCAHGGSAVSNDAVMAFAFSRTPVRTYTHAERAKARRFIMETWRAAGMPGEPGRDYSQSSRQPANLPSRDDEDADVFRHVFR
jgi:hypothetical protein